jgi:hypothetical protein
MTSEQFENFKKPENVGEVFFIGKYLYKIGSYGLSKHKKDRHFTKLSHCNDFRNKSFEQVRQELK